MVYVVLSLYDYPIPGKDGLSICKIHGKKLEMLEVVIFDREATELSPPDPCRKPSAALLQRMG